MCKHPTTSLHDTGHAAHEAVRQENIVLSERIAELEAQHKSCRKMLKHCSDKVIELEATLDDFRESNRILRLDRDALEQGDEV
jgi:chromosome segregation ATPase